MGLDFPAEVDLLFEVEPLGLEPDLVLIEFLVLEIFDFFRFEY